MRVIIAGSRTISDQTEVFLAVADSGFDITEVVSGGAQGVDSLGEHFAKHNQLPVKKFPANWDLYGRVAGPIRNRLMAKYGDALILVWDGKSRGSASMLREAKAAGIFVYQHIVE